MYKYEEIFSFDNLYLSHLRARKCKRHKREVVNFELNLSSNLTKLEKDLKDGTYKIMGYKRFMIYDPKEREIQALSYYDRIVQNCLCYNFLVPFYGKKLIYDNCACQKGKGTHFCRARLEKFLHSFYRENGSNGYILKIDIKKYFNNIDHTILKQKLGVIYDARLKDLVYQVIDGYNFDTNKGVPMGNQSSQIFALLYLNEVDRLIKEKYRIKYYVRYMDDLVIIHKDKKLLAKLFEDVRKIATKIKLILNNKSHISALKNGIEFLGVKYSLQDNGKLLKRVKPQSKKRFIKCVKRIFTLCKKDLLTNDKLKMSIAGFWGNVKRLMVNGIINRYMVKLKKLAMYG